MNDRTSEYTDYCLRYLSLHLRQANLTSRLYILARDNKFTSHQREGFPKEPEVSTSTQRAAITAAADAEDYIGVAEFCLRHLITLMELRSESPLAVTSAGNLERAWRLSDYSDADTRSLWHILIAWFLRVRGERVGSTSTLKRLLDSTVSTIHPGRYLDQENWKNTIALFLLEALGHHDHESALEIANRLLPSDQVGDLRGSIDRAREIGPQQIWRSSGQHADLVAQAFGHAENGQIKNAREVLDQVRFDGYGFRTRAYIDVMRRLIAVNKELEACLIASCALRPVEDYEQVESSRLQALAEIGCDTVLAGHSDEGKSFLQIAQEQATAINNIVLRFQACRKVACGWARLGDVNRARNSIPQIMGEDDEQARAEIYVEIAGITAETGDANSAIAMLNEIPEPAWIKSFRNDAVAAISSSLARRGQHEFALSVANEIVITDFVSDVESQSWAEHAKAFGPIAIAQAEAGDMDGALATFEELIKPKSISDPGPAQEYWQQVYSAAETVLLNCYQNGLEKEGDRIIDLLTSHRFADSRDLAQLKSALTHARSGAAEIALDPTASIKDAYWRAATQIKLTDILTQTAHDKGVICHAVELSLDSAEKADQFWQRLALLQRLEGALKRFGSPSLLTRTARALGNLIGMLPNNPEAALCLILPVSVRMVGVKLSSDILVQAAHWAQPTYDSCVLLARLSESTTSVGRLVCTLRLTRSENNLKFVSD